MILLKKLLNSPIESITSAAIILGATSLASKILGVIRNRILAGTFGAGDVLDSYYAAFRLPDLIFNLVVLGALSAGFIPIFAGLIKEAKGHSRNPASMTTSIMPQWQFAANVFNFFVIILAILAGGLIIFAPKIIPLTVPGFSQTGIDLTVRMSRLMAVGPIFLGISAVLAGILQSYRYFLIYSVAPLFYNLGIILGAVFLTPWLGPMGLAWGVVGGTILHALIQVPAVIALGFRWRSVLDFKDVALRQLGKLMLPRTFSLAISQLNFVAMTVIASTLTVGSITVFNFANDIQNFPLGLFSLSLATAAFPAFASLAAAKDYQSLRRNFQNTASLILFLTIPAAILLLLLRAQIVRVLLGWGEFNWEDTITTADTLAFFSLSLFAQGLLPLLVRVFYALQDTWRPFIIGLFSTAVNILLALYLKDLLGIAGLSLAFSVATIINVILLWAILHHRIGCLGEAQIVPSLLKVSLASLAMAITVQAVKYLVAPLVNMHTFNGIALQGLVATVLGLFVFIVISLLLKNQEMIIIKRAFTRRLFKGKEVHGLTGEGGIGSG